jgi:hypothetical protein
MACHLLTIGLAETYDVNGITSVCDDRDVQALPDEAIDLPAPLAVVLPRVVHDQRCTPVNIRHQPERQAAFRDIPSVSSPGRT